LTSSAQKAATASKSQPYAFGHRRFDVLAWYCFSHCRSGSLWPRGYVFVDSCAAPSSGTWAVLRDTPDGVFCPYNLNEKHPRLEALLNKSKVDDWFGVLGGAPAVFSVVFGVAIFGVRCLGWLGTATWKRDSIQAVYKWPIAPGDVATGWVGLDQIVWWFLADAPAELWLILIFPSIWIATGILPSVIEKRLRRRQRTAT
jgi:hypothetical protein